MEGKYVQQFKKGALEMVPLCLIAQRETYGYEIPFSTGCKNRGWCKPALPQQQPTVVPRNIIPSRKKGSKF